MGSRGGKSSQPRVHINTFSLGTSSRTTKKHVVVKASSYLEVATVKGTVRINHHHSKMPAKEVLVVDLCTMVSYALYKSSSPTICLHRP